MSELEKLYAAEGAEENPTTSRRVATRELTCFFSEVVQRETFRLSRQLAEICDSTLS
jgi:hypothetical protein